eukprot:6756222-Pyramimonas_sp.AAC.1
MPAKELDGRPQRRPPFRQQLQVVSGDRGRGKETSGEREIVLVYRPGNGPNNQKLGFSLGDLGPNLKVASHPSGLP